MYYKHIGQRKFNEAREICSEAGDNVHLPIPRFPEENEFYRTYFVNESLWLDINDRYDNNNFQTSGDFSFMLSVRTLTGEVQINNFDWFTLNITDKPNFNKIMMTNTGQWELVKQNEFIDSVCVFNIQPDRNCAECWNEDFCRFNDDSKQQTKCICPNTRRGDYCEIDLCSQCQNRGSCRMDNDGNGIECICPRPFDGKYCEIKACSHCQNGGDCKDSTGENESDCIFPFPFTGTYCELNYFIHG